MNEEITIVKKGKYIDEVIGGILFPLGFERVQGGSDWEYKKEVINKKGETIILSVMIYKHRFADSVFMQLDSTAMGRGMKRLNEFPGYMNSDGSIYYENDDKFKDAVNEIGRVIKDYGIEWLEGALEPIIDDYYKEEDYRKIYLEHDQLADSFAERMNISIEDISLREAFKVVEKIIKNSTEKSFKEMVPLFLEMSSFLAKVNGKKKKYEWKLLEYEKKWICYLYIYNSVGKIEKISTVMDTMIVGWKCNESHLIEWLMGDFDLPPDGHQIISE